MFNEPDSGLRNGFIEHLRLTWVAQQSVPKIILVTIMNLVTPNAGADLSFKCRVVNSVNDKPRTYWIRETLLNGKAQYSWTPGTNYFWSAAFWYCKHCLLFHKTSYLNVEVNCTEPFPSVSVPWWNNSIIENKFVNQKTTNVFYLWTS
jgi:hypothetical protein